jgi:hypothetical protein
LETMETQFSCRPPPHLFTMSDYGGENDVDSSQAPDLIKLECLNAEEHAAELSASVPNVQLQDINGSLQSSTCLEHNQPPELARGYDNCAGLDFSFAPLLNSGQHVEITDLLQIPDRFEIMKLEIEKLRSEFQNQSATTRSLSTDSESNDDLDPSEESTIWNTNSLCILMWSAIFWPAGRTWNHDTEQFGDRTPRREGPLRSRSQRWIERHVCPLLFMALAPSFLFIEMCILSGVMDQGFNLKSHIYGDSYYQSPTWRYSGAAHLRVKFVHGGREEGGGRSGRWRGSGREVGEGP